VPTATTASTGDDVRLDGVGVSLTEKSAADREHQWGFRWRARLRRRLAARRDRSSAAAARAKQQCIHMKRVASMALVIYRDGSRVETWGWALGRSG
jgi:hypothetical protein